MGGRGGDRFFKKKTLILIPFDFLLVLLHKWDMPHPNQIGGVCVCVCVCMGVVVVAVGVYVCRNCNTSLQVSEIMSERVVQPRQNVKESDC